MKIKTADFVKSSKKWTECPEPNLPEFAFIGRSNVGKSSLINALTARKYLAKTSSTPGKTQLINHFSINQQWYLTDLPGYGYAKVSKTHRKEFQKLITDYLTKRTSLTNIFLLIDSRHEPLTIDLDFIYYLGENMLPFSIVFTKYDKVKPKEFESKLNIHKQRWLEIFSEEPNYFITSSEKKSGCDEILNFIDATIEQIDVIKQQNI